MTQFRAGPNLYACGDDSGIIARMPMHLVSHYHDDERDLYAVHAPTGTDALTLVRAAHPGALGRFRVDSSTAGELVAFPRRGRPPRLARKRWAAHEDAAPWADIV